MKTIGRFLLAAALAAPALATATERYREEVPPPHAVGTRPTTREFTELPPGRYTVSLTGLICTVCGRAIAAKWAKLPEIESVSVDFNKSSAVIAVRLGRTLRVSVLRKALRPAEKLANLGARYDLSAISYRLGK